MSEGEALFPPIQPGIMQRFAISDVFEPGPGREMDLLALERPRHVSHMRRRTQDRRHVDWKNLIRPLSEGTCPNYPSQIKFLCRHHPKTDW
jgi:hypothetical protein